MNVNARARASAQAIDRSATRLDPVVGLDDLLRRHRRQPLQRAAAAALALLVAVVAIWTGVVLRGPTPIQPTLGPVTRFRVGPAPVSVAVTPGAAWVLNSGDSTISRIDPRTGRVQSSFPVSGRRAEVGLVFATVAEGRLWVVHQCRAWTRPRSRHRPVDRPDVDHLRVRRLCPPTNTASRGTWRSGQGLSGSPSKARTRSSGSTPPPASCSTGIPLPEPTALAVDGQTVWVASVDGRLRRIDVATGAVTARATTELVTRIRVGQGGMWLMTFDGKVLRVDRRTGRIVAQVSGTFQAADLAVGAEGVWVYDQRQGAVLRIDPGTNRVVRTIPVISQPLVELYSRVLALGDGAVWVVDKAARPWSGSTRTADPG